MRLSNAICCARSTFFAVMGKNAPAFTVASFATIMHSRPATRPMPVITPAPGAPPNSAYIPYAAHSPSSIHSESLSSNRARRSRAVSRPFLCWASTALAPPPSRIVSSSARMPPSSACMAARLAANFAESSSSFEPSPLVATSSAIYVSSRFADLSRRLSEKNPQNPQG